MPVVRFQLRRDTAANWTAANPVLRAGEPALETDTNNVKYGDGVNDWDSLPYASHGAPVPALASGVYTPTTALVFGVSAAVPSVCQYLRVGNTVTVSGKVDVDPSAIGSVIFRMSLPIPSAFVESGQAAGVASTGYGIATQNAAIGAGPANFVEFYLEATDASNRTFWFSFTYRVV